MDRPCDSCGKVYWAKRPASKFCSDTCRKRASRSPKPADVSPPLPAPLASSVDLVSATTEALEAAGRLESPLGRQALVLAARVSSPLELGSAVASLSRELRAVMADALADVSAAADPLDELRARRDRKRTG